LAGLCDAIIYLKGGKIKSLYLIKHHTKKFWGELEIYIYIYISPTFSNPYYVKVSG
jgi:hypothetical protein